MKGIKVKISMAKENPGYTDSVRKLMDLLGKLPGVGARSAERITFHLLKSKPEEVLALADALRAVKEHVRYCSICYNLTETDICTICADPARDHSVVCIVEQPKDLLQFESTGVFKGVYHVLLGRLAPLDNVGPGELTIAALLERLKPAPDSTPSPIKELILATNPTMEGDGTALYLQNLLAPTGHTITRLARGLPAGAQIEYSNKTILADALTARTRL